MIEIPAHPDLDNSITEAARSALGKAGDEPGPADWLAPVIACDISFAGVLPDAAGVRIDHGDLTALLYLQGYRRDEFID
ncbi:MAG: hypothetical protein O7I42_27395 [Alphaproteobacteria bacterium]|nr:hypothetical protein [Alphaproteobacteria bacterium]